MTCLLSLFEDNQRADQCNNLDHVNAILAGVNLDITLYSFLL